MSLLNCLLLSGALFGIGLFGLLARRNIIAVFLSIELMLNAGLINFVAFSHYAPSGSDAAAGIVFPLFIIALTSSEMAVGLAIVVALYRRHKRIDIEEVSELHG